MIVESYNYVERYFRNKLFSRTGIDEQVSEINDFHVQETMGIT